MTVLRMILRELLALFVDDGALAIAIILLVMFAALLAGTLPVFPLVAGGVLLFGSLAVLLVSVLRAPSH